MMIMRIITYYLYISSIIEYSSSFSSLKIKAKKHSFKWRRRRKMRHNEIHTHTLYKLKMFCVWFFYSKNLLKFVVFFLIFFLVCCNSYPHIQRWWEGDVGRRECHRIVTIAPTAKPPIHRKMIIITSFFSLSIFYKQETLT